MSTQGGVRRGIEPFWDGISDVGKEVLRVEITGQPSPRVYESGKRSQTLFGRPGGIVVSGDPPSDSGDNSVSVSS